LLPLGGSLSGARARASLPLCPNGLGQLVTAARARAGAPPAGGPPARPRPTPGPPRGASRRANSASQLAASLPQPRATCAPAALLAPSLPRHPCARARAPLPVLARRRRPPGPYTAARAGPPPARLPLRPRAPPTALLLHRPTDLDRAPIVRANVPVSESRSGGGPLSLADCAPPTRPCALANWPPPFVVRRPRARASPPASAWPDLT